MTVIVGLLIGNETWGLMERSIRSLRLVHPDQPVMIYYSLDSATGSDIINTLGSLGVETVDIGKPGLMGLFSAADYSTYDSAEFNIKTSFKWLALLETMKSKKDSVIFVDADIKIISPLPFAEFDKIWQSYDVFVQDEGISTFPRNSCTGFMGFKFCEASISLLESLHKEHCATIVSFDSQHDQAVFNDFLSRSSDVCKRVYFLPQMLFPVGYLAPLYRGFLPSEQSLNKLVDPQVNPVIFHANWAIGVEAKEALMDCFSSHDFGACMKSEAGRVSLAQEKLDHFRERLRQLEVELGNVREHLYLEQQALGMSRSALVDAQSELKQAQSELKQAQSELKQAQSELKQVQSELTQAQSGIENLRGVFTEAESELVNLRQFETQARHSYKTHVNLIWIETVSRWRRITRS